MTTLPQVGKYETLEQIGTGGFGVVYKARDPHIQRLVAIKLCTSRDEEVRRRFLREAKIAGSLQHASIVTLFDLGFSDHGPYLVQEYLSGEDLEAKIARREPLPQSQRLEILARIAAGLRHAHERGILHRDIKPANVRILDDGRVKILDFGIAKLFGAETQLTKKGTILGTAGYLAPEQISGRSVDERTDAFAFGVLAYELLTYEHPFPGDKIREVLRRVLEEDPEPISKIEPEVPAEVADLVSRCLAKDREVRPAGFGEIEDVLALFVEGTGTGTGTRPKLPKALGEAHPTEDPDSDESAHTQVVPDPGELTPSPPGESAEEHGREESGAAVAPPPPPPVAGEGPPTRPVSSAPVPAPTEPPRRKVPRRSTRPSQPRPWLAVGVAVVALLLVGGGLWWWLTTETVVMESPADSSETPTEPPPVVPSKGQLLIEAAPWGRVVSVTGSNGSIELPPDATTPLLLVVPPDTYRVELMHPDSEEPATCEAEVPDADRGRCSVELTEIDVMDYFRETGWWR